MGLHFLPEEHAAQLAAPVGAAIAAQPRQNHAVPERPDGLGLPRRQGADAGAVRPDLHLEDPPTVGQHLGHEGQRLQGGVGIEGGPDLHRGKHLHPVSRQQHEGSILLPAK